jgi:zinc transport system ATP-binding protein
VKIGYVPQNLHIDETLPITVARFLRLPGGVAVADIGHALTQAGVPDLATAQLSKLSGGQFQRVLLARALIGKPDLLLLDEATQGLDQRGSASFYQQIETVRQDTGCAILMISHELHQRQNTGHCSGQEPAAHWHFIGMNTITVMITAIIVPFIQRRLNNA